MWVFFFAKFFYYSMGGVSIMYKIYTFVTTLLTFVLVFCFRFNSKPLEILYVFLILALFLLSKKIGKAINNKYKEDEADT